MLLRAPFPLFPEDFWTRKMSEWRIEEQNIEIALQGSSDSYGDPSPP
jgi:hypothetical protein